MSGKGEVSGLAAPGRLSLPDHRGGITTPLEILFPFPSCLYCMILLLRFYYFVIELVMLCTFYNTGALPSVIQTIYSVMETFSYVMCEKA